MDDSGAIQNDADIRAARRLWYETLDKAELEALTIAAIREHRALFSSDEAAYEAWVAAQQDEQTPRARLEDLQADYLARQKRAAAQQDELSDMLDVLGFVPNLPEDERR
jgi:hypothetical protein